MKMLGLFAKSKVGYKAIMSILTVAVLLSCNNGKIVPTVPDGFVLIPESYVLSEGDSVKIGAFEILDHPVTNREYSAFVNATGYPPPFIGKTGRFPRDLRTIRSYMLIVKMPMLTRNG